MNLWGHTQFLFIWFDGARSGKQEIDQSKHLIIHLIVVNQWNPGLKSKGAPPATQVREARVLNWRESVHNKNVSNEKTFENDRF
jgi:hypothetical protein